MQILVRSTPGHIVADQIREQGKQDVPGSEQNYSVSVMKLMLRVKNSQAIEEDGKQRKIGDMLDQRSERCGSHGTTARDDLSKIAADNAEHQSLDTIGSKQNDSQDYYGRKCDAERGQPGANQSVSLAILWSLSTYGSVESKKKPCTK